MTAVLLTPLTGQFFDNNGNPLVGGLIYSYVAGTNTPQASYTDASGSTPAANPVVLDSAGRADIWGSGVYKFVIKDSVGNTIDTIDNLTAIYGSGDMLKSTYDVANISQQVVGTTAVQTITNKTFTSPNINGNTAGTGLINPCEGRLTLTTGVPVTTGDVTGATSVFFTPYFGNKISLYTGGNWIIYKFSEMTLALGTLTSGKPYDVFIDFNSGSPQLVSLVWTSDTARATALVYQDGVLVRSGTLTQRYLGTFYTTSTTATEDSLLNRYLWNYYNRVNRAMLRTETAASWSYSTATIRQANANTANQLNFLLGVSEDAISATVRSHLGNSSTTVRSVETGIGLNSTTAYSNMASFHAMTSPLTSVTVSANANYYGLPPVGRNFLTWLESGAGADTQTWFGAGTSVNLTTGISGIVRA